MKAWIRYPLILLASIVLASVTFQLPFLIGDDLVIETSSYLHGDDEELNAEIEALLEQESLSEEDLQRLTEKVGQAQASGPESQASVEALEREAQAEARRASAFWLVPIWLVFFALLPRTLPEFAVTLAMPLLLFSVGALVTLEIAIILTMAALVYGLKWVKSKGQSR